MQEPDDAGLGPRWAMAGALGLSALLPLVELGRIALSEPAAGLAAAVVVVALSLPLHLRHVLFALRGQRASHAGWSLAAMAVLMGWATVAVSASWGFMLSSLAVSVLLTVRPPWSLVLFGAVLAAAYGEGALTFADDLGGGTAVYIAAAVMFRSICLFAVIRLVAEVRSLDRARDAVASAAVEHQRADTALRLTRSLVEDLERVAQRAQRLSAPAQAREEVTQLVQQSRRILADVRAIVSQTRGAGAQRELADAGRLLRGDSAVGERSLASESSPAASLTGGIRRSMGLLVLVRVVVLAMLLALAAGVAYPSALPPWVFVVILLISGLEFQSSLRTALSMGTDRMPWSAAAATAALVVTLVWVEPRVQFNFTSVLVAATVALQVRGRWRFLAVVTLLPVMIGTGLADVLTVNPSAADLVWYLAYEMAVFSLGVVSLVASARLVGAVRALEATRVVLAEQAVDEENRRFARDLHDTLVQSLSAVALTGDLVLRLIERDPEAAADELVHLRGLAAGLAEDARRVRQDQRSVTLAGETQVAAQLLRAAGIEADIRVEATPVSAQADALLGWAVREAATNVVRHSAATRCAIAVTQEDGHLGLLVVNDGVQQADQSGGGQAGSGLAGLADRARALRGSVQTEAGQTGQFRLRVRVPEVVA